MSRLQRGFLTFGVLILLWLLPVPEGLSAAAWHLFAIFAPSSSVSSCSPCRLVLWHWPASRWQH